VDKLRIFLAEDHSVMREGLKMLVNAQPDMEVIGEAGDGLTAWQLAKELKPDVVVMDISMPQASGHEATQKLRQTSPDIKILALTVHEERGYLRALLEAGVSGYLLKRVAAEELILAIRKVAEGGVYLDPSLASKVVGSFVHQESPPHVLQGSELSDREAEVTRLIAQGFSYKEIANQLHISVKTVETYKARAMEKLNLSSRADIVRYAIRQGWLHEL
jgi:DNA-binding NarL/FixJ family response regulator